MDQLLLLLLLGLRVQSVWRSKRRRGMQAQDRAGWSSVMVVSACNSWVLQSRRLCWTTIAS